ncbi:hypothetical protein I352_03442 [Cryptococcus deuterogattii MMRL2647]|nr:hypothetical protein I352_03442 [Cryptococcus deuterogattii MMRL2647]
MDLLDIQFGIAISSTTAAEIRKISERGAVNKKHLWLSLMKKEKTGHRDLLREVIEEKEKKGEAEHGGSKGRKLRTVHEKAQNSVVPIPLSQGWHEEQVDELFSFNLDVRNADEELAEHGGLRIF